MSAPSGSGGASGVGVVLGGAGGMVATASARTFAQNIHSVEATRLDWDFSKRVSSVAGVGATVPIDSITLGRGTWHVQVQLYLSGTLSTPLCVSLESPAGGFIYDICGLVANTTSQVMMEAIIAVGATDAIRVVNGEVGLAAAERLTWLWLAKRITR